uniref:PID domain-containing protein n=1 Tax=Electrophorus electricus TaxID=8005 RepID=A0AAY5F6C1_ELEEL
MGISGLVSQPSFYTYVEGSAGIKPMSARAAKHALDEEEKVQYRLTLVGSLAVHPQTTMAMLPWVVAEIRRPRLKERATLKPSCFQVRDKPVLLQVSASWVRCTLDVAGPGGLQDPLRHTILFEQRPHRVAKLIRNSQEPSTFGCLLRDDAAAACYVFRCLEQREVGSSLGEELWGEVLQGGRGGGGYMYDLELLLTGGCT